jgi:hypothetical protein
MHLPWHFGRLQPQKEPAMKKLYWDSTEIDPWTGQRYTWDSPNPNVTWDGILEPGDPGYTPPPNPSPRNRKTKRNTMKHQAYYPSRYAEQVQWLENFIAKISGYATALGLDPAVVADIIKDARWVMYVIGPWLTANRAHNLACTQAAKQAQTGTGGMLTLPVFTAPALPAGTVPRDEGSLTRIFDLVAEIKENNGCTDAMCSDLRIVGAESSGPDFATLAPELTVEITGNTVKLGWGWQGYRQWLDQCEIQVDRSDGKGWVILTFDTTPNYVDSHPFPSALAQWKYRAIYRVDDVQVGQWSPVVTLNVGN